jgi:hypothetical protein
MILITVIERSELEGIFGVVVHRCGIDSPRSGPALNILRSTRAQTRESLEFARPTRARLSKHPSFLEAEVFRPGQQSPVQRLGDQGSRFAESARRLKKGRLGGIKVNF